MSKTYYSPIPLKNRTFALVQFILTHKTSKIVIVSCGNETVDFLTRYMQLIGHPVMRIHQKIEQQQRKNTEKRFKDSNEGACLITTRVLIKSIDIGKVDWFVYFAVPPKVPEFIDCIKSVNHDKFLFFVDPEREKEIISRIEESDIKFMELPFDAKKIPNMLPRLLKFLDKDYDFYMRSQFGYREMINSYVYSENPEFDAEKINLCSASISYGIKFPPKLPLSKK